MARPRKVGLDYFSHDTDVSTDDKIAAMELKFGAVGYALYFKCLERIYRQGGPIDTTGVFRAIISGRLRVSEEEIDKVLDFAISIDLLYREEDGKLMSRGAKKRLDFIEKERERDRNRDNRNYPPENQPIRGERKGKEIKEKEKDQSDLHLGDSGITKNVIDYLNEKTGKRFRTGAATAKLIGARAKEGFTLEDFRKVIDIKCADWLRDPAMEQYLRPETLFRASKMDGYLNQKNAGVQRMNGRHVHHEQAAEVEFGADV